MASRVSRQARSPTAIVPGEAADCSLEATWRAPPVSSPAASRPSAATTSPVSTPILISSSRPARGASSGCSAREAVEHRERRPNGALGVVLVRNRSTEHGDDAVARVLLHRAAEALDLLRHRLEERRSRRRSAPRGRAGRRARSRRRGRRTAPSRPCAPRSPPGAAATSLPQAPQKRLEAATGAPQAGQGAAVMTQRRVARGARRGRPATRRRGRCTRPSRG